MLGIPWEVVRTRREIQRASYCSLRCWKERRSRVREGSVSFGTQVLRCRALEMARKLLVPVISAFLPLMGSFVKRGLWSVLASLYCAIVLA